MFRGRNQDLEEQQPGVEQELRRLMEKPGEGFRGKRIQRNSQQNQSCGLNYVFVFFFVCAEHLKTAWDNKREAELMEKLLEIIKERDSIVDGLDEDRLRCVFRRIGEFILFLSFTFYWFLILHVNKQRTKQST